MLCKAFVPSPDSLAVARRARAGAAKTIKNHIRDVADATANQKYKNQFYDKFHVFLRGTGLVAHRSCIDLRLARLARAALEQEPAQLQLEQE
jgi:hypothetical protein